MTRSRGRKTIRWGALLLLLLALAAGAQTADAAKGGKKVARVDKGVTDGASLAVEDDSPHAGDIDPTTVPIVDDDLLFSVAVTRAQIQADEAHALATGAGIVVAVLDSGFNLDHPDIALNVLPGYDALDHDDDVTDLGDGIDNDGDGTIDRGVGHGTFVIGMILTAAPDAMILPIRVRNDEGYGSDKALMRGIDYAIAMGVDVVNFSGGLSQTFSRHTIKRFESLIQAGITVCAAAGNDGWDGVSRVCNTAMGVSAVDRYDRLAQWSNYQTHMAPAPTVLCAPGVDLYGPVGSPLYDGSGYWSGTSFATGLASGAAALVLEVFPRFSPQDVFARLEATCDPAWDRHGDLMLDGGRINLYRAVTE